MGKTDTVAVYTKQYKAGVHAFTQVGTRAPTWSTHSQSFLLGLHRHLSVDFLFGFCGLQTWVGVSEQGQTDFFPVVWPLAKHLTICCLTEQTRHPDTYILPSALLHTSSMTLICPLWALSPNMPGPAPRAAQVQRSLRTCTQHLRGSAIPAAWTSLPCSPRPQINKSKDISKNHWEFPSGPGVRIPGLYCWRPGFNPWMRN